MHFAWCQVHCRKMGTDMTVPVLCINPGRQSVLQRSLSRGDSSSSQLQKHCTPPRCPVSYTIETIGRHTSSRTAILSCPAISQWQQAITDSIKPPFPHDQELYLQTTFLGYEAKGMETFCTCAPSSLAEFGTSPGFSDLGITPLL